jgi:hypothetical protein
MSREDVLANAKRAVEEDGRRLLQDQRRLGAATDLARTPDVAEALLVG